MSYGEKLTISVAPVPWIPFIKPNIFFLIMLHPVQLLRKIQNVYNTQIWSSSTFTLEGREIMRCVFWTWLYLSLSYNQSQRVPQVIYLCTFITVKLTLSIMKMPRVPSSEAEDSFGISATHLHSSQVILELTSVTFVETLWKILGDHFLKGLRKLLLCHVWCRSYCYKGINSVVLRRFLQWHIQRDWLHE